jgi:hypothetical protein
VAYSSSEQKKVDMMNTLLGSLDSAFINPKDEKPPLGDWAVKNSVVLDGREFSFKKHEYLIEPYADTHPFQVEIKAAQLGLTSKALLRVCHGARYGRYRGILYLFPSKTDVTDLSKGRLDPLIDDNPETIGSWVKDTDASNIKKIWDSYLYLRGMVSKVGLKSVPIDMIVFDELDEAPQKNVDMAMERMGHSDTGESLFLSNPTMPDYGIDRLWQTTDMRYWLLKCPKCGHYTNLVDTFPECLITVKGKVIRACEKCHAELNPSVGQWVAKHPSVTERRGRQYSQLFSQTKTTTPELMLHNYRTTTNITSYMNLKVGVAYVEAQNRLSVREVLDCCGKDGIRSSSDVGTFMGVDQGGKLHVVIGKASETRVGEVVHVGIYKGNNTSNKEDESGWRELDSLMNRFKVMRCIVDALPNTKSARSFAERFPGRVYLNFYNEHQKGSLKWNEKELIVQGNRTETLDASHNLITTQNIILPRESSDIMQTFANHMHNVAKRLEEDEDTGSQRYVYLKLGDDHFRHAFNYFSQCLLSCPEYMFPELM